jgi:hypothetical protein
VLGGYTTFSTLQLDAVGLGGRKDCVPAASYHLLSVFVRLLAAVLGATLARALGLGGLTVVNIPYWRLRSSAEPWVL